MSPPVLPVFPADVTFSKEGNMSATKQCPHDLYEEPSGWWCRVCGGHVMVYQRISFLRVWAECRELRRAMSEWRNG